MGFIHRTVFDTSYAKTSSTIATRMTVWIMGE